MIKVYKKLDKYDQEMIWTMIQTIRTISEKRKSGEKDDKYSDT